MGRVTTELGMYAGVAKIVRLEPRLSLSSVILIVFVTPACI